MFSEKEKEILKTGILLVIEGNSAFLQKRVWDSKGNKKSWSYKAAC